MHPHLNAYMHTCIHAYMHTCIHAYMHTCIHTHTRIHAFMHTHMCAISNKHIMYTHEHRLPARSSPWHFSTTFSGSSSPRPSSARTSWSPSLQASMSPSKSWSLSLSVRALPRARTRPFLPPLVCVCVFACFVAGGMQACDRCSSASCCRSRRRLSGGQRAMRSGHCGLGAVH